MPTTQDLLAIYLNDHAAGATAGLELFKRAAGDQAESPRGPELKRLAAEIEEDRAALLAMLAALEIPVRQYKLAAGWAGEKIGRLKLNGSLLQRSPLSDLVELEAMRLGVEGKAAGWHVLRDLSQHEPRLDVGQLDTLIERAGRQSESLEAMRLAVATEIFRSER